VTVSLLLEMAVPASTHEATAPLLLNLNVRVVVQLRYSWCFSLKLKTKINPIFGDAR